MQNATGQLAKAGRRRLRTAAWIIAAAWAAPHVAADTVFDFYLLSGADDLSGQFAVTLSQGADADHAAFTIANNGPTASSITDVYWEDSYANYLDFGASPTYLHSGGNAQNPWDFSAAPGDLPGGAGVGFTAIGGGAADSSPPPTHNGVQVGETIRFEFALRDQIDFADLLDAILGPGYRIGLHVQGQGAGETSSSYLTLTPAAVPTPGAALLGGLGAACVITASRFNRGRQSRPGAK